MLQVNKLGILLIGSSLLFMLVLLSACDGMSSYDPPSNKYVDSNDEDLDVTEDEFEDSENLNNEEPYGYDDSEYHEEDYVYDGNSSHLSKIYDEEVDDYSHIKENAEKSERAILSHALGVSGRHEDHQQAKDLLLRHIEEEGEFVTDYKNLAGMIMLVSEIHLSLESGYKLDVESYLYDIDPYYEDSSILHPSYVESLLDLLDTYYDISLDEWAMLYYY